MILVHYNIYSILCLVLGTLSTASTPWRWGAPFDIHIPKTLNYFWELEGLRSFDIYLASWQGYSMFICLHPSLSSSAER